MDKLLQWINENKKRCAAVPFLTFNDGIEKTVLIEKIGKIAEAGAGGFFMHARSGLRTKYLSDEWMEAARICAVECERLGLGFYVYDEQGWPSGFAGGRVNGLGADYHIKWLVMEECSAGKRYENALGFYDPYGNALKNVNEPPEEGFFVAWRSSAGYVDLFNPDVTRAFIECTHEKYYAALGNRVKGIFTDEPQYGERQIPYSPFIFEEYRKRYGTDPADGLLALFVKRDGYEAERLKYFRVVADLFMRNYFRPVSEWCRERGLVFTGHGLEERAPSLQVMSGGDLMSAYEYMDWPGMDWLGRDIGTEIAPKQVSSIALQLNKSGTISEMYALAGWNPSVAELKLIAEWQFVNGVSRICYINQYSVRGNRKRDYPSGLVFEQPYYETVKLYNDYFSALGCITGGLREYAPVLLISPLDSAYVARGAASNPDSEALDADFEALAEFLGVANIGHHIGNPDTMRRHARTESGKLFVGECMYEAVVLPRMLTLDGELADLLTEFGARGGLILSPWPLPEPHRGAPAGRIELLEPYVTVTRSLNEVADAVDKAGLRLARIEKCGGDVRSTLRFFEDESILYVLNQSRSEAAETVVSMPGTRVRSLDLESGTLLQTEQTVTGGRAYARLSLPPMQSRALVFDAGRAKPFKRSRIERVCAASAVWTAGQIENALVLDLCDYCTDGGEWQPEKPVILLFNELLEKRRDTRVKMRFAFTVADGAGKLYLAVEQPERFAISLNGCAVRNGVCGIFNNEHIKKIEINGHVRTGYNEIVLETVFHQEPDTYRLLLDDGVLESERNMVTLDTELENIYIVGDFGVKCADAPRRGGNGSSFFMPPFIVGPPIRQFTEGDFTSQGLPFFAGKLRLKNTVDIADLTAGEIRFGFVPEAAAATLFINGEKVKTFVWGDCEADIRPYARIGSNTVEIELYSGLRNFFGPHHNFQGEPFFTGISTFTDKRGWCDPETDRMWDGRYALVPFGLKRSTTV
ncbi:glycoside hydrolase [Clostridia bacterium]|nr:glycoside hydrolase [Clostridia bacterium]